MNFTIAICDDDAAMTHYLGENIQIEFSKQNRICTPHLFTDPHKLMEQLAVMAYHMVFLDMDMPGVIFALPVSSSCPCRFISLAQVKRSCTPANV